MAEERSAGGSIFDLYFRVRERPQIELHAHCQEVLHAGLARLEEGEITRAACAARQALAGTSDPGLAAAGAKLLMWARLLEDRAQEAAEVVAGYPSDYPKAPVLIEEALTAAGGQGPAVALLRKLFRAEPNDVTGMVLVRGLVETGRLDEAVALVTGPHGRRIGVNTAALVAMALFRVGRFEQAAKIGSGAFVKQSHPRLAYNVACSWARAGEDRQALTWLARAVRAGFRDIRRLEGDPDLSAVRNHPYYPTVRHRLLSLRAAENGGPPAAGTSAPGVPAGGPAR